MRRVIICIGVCTGDWEGPPAAPLPREPESNPWCQPPPPRGAAYYPSYTPRPSACSATLYPDDDDCPQLPQRWLFNLSATLHALPKCKGVVVTRHKVFQRMLSKMSGHGCAVGADEGAWDAESEYRKHIAWRREDALARQIIAYRGGARELPALAVAGRGVRGAGMAGQVPLEAHRRAHWCVGGGDRAVAVAHLWQWRWRPQVDRAPTRW